MSKQLLLQLNLEQNRLQELPSDLSMLLSIEEIRINKNQFRDVFKTINSLTTLPNLKSLHINLSTEEQVDFIMKHLPQLEMLNGLDVEHSLAEEEEEEDEEPMIQAQKSERSE